MTLEIRFQNIFVIFQFTRCAIVLCVCCKFAWQTQLQAVDHEKDDIDLRMERGGLDVFLHQ